MNLENYRQTSMIAVKNMTTGQFTLVCEATTESKAACKAMIEHHNNMAKAPIYDITYFTAYTVIPKLTWK